MSAVRIFVPSVPEFSSLVRAASAMPSCKVTKPRPEYHLIESDQPIEFHRKDLGFKPAVWYGIFTGGLKGRIEVFDRDRVRLVPGDQ
jgi:hypothetical protein